MSKNYNVLKNIGFIFFVFFLITFFNENVMADATIENYQIGDNVFAEIETSYTGDRTSPHITVTISGEGSTWDFTNTGYDVSGMYTLPYNANNVEKFIIEEGITRIGDYLFYSQNNSWIARGRKRVIELPTTLNDIGEYAFSNDAYLYNISIPEGVKTIGKGSFENCENITNIELPSTLEVIGANVFANCHSLENITIPGNVTSIGDSAFYFCPTLTNIILPENLTSIGSMCFLQCMSLQSIYISENVTSISNDAFIMATPTIYAPKNSIASEFANDNGFPYVEICSIKNVNNKSLVYSGHDIYTETVPATYVSKGYIAEKCSHCKEVFSLQITEQLVTSTPKEKLSQPVIIDIQNIKKGISFNWNSIEDATSYNIYRKGETDNWTLLDNVSSTYYLDTNVSNTNIYYYMVKSLDDNIESTQDTSFVCMIRMITPNLLGYGRVPTETELYYFSKAWKLNGIEVEFSFNPDMNNSNTIQLNSVSDIIRQSNYISISSKKYYLRIKTYRIYNGITYYSSYTDIVSI